MKINLIDVNDSTGCYHPPTEAEVAGYLAFTHALTWRLLPVSAAILLLAFAACALNEVQQHKLDAMMERTKVPKRIKGGSSGFFVREPLPDIASPGLGSGHPTLAGGVPHVRAPQAAPPACPGWRVLTTGRNSRRAAGMDL